MWAYKSARSFVYFQNQDKQLATTTYEKGANNSY